MTLKHKRDRKFTKIVATIGPATSSKQKIKDLILAGADILRLNFSHADFKAKIKNIEDIRDVEQEIGRTVAILADLPGPKIRIMRFEKSFIELEKGQNFMIHCNYEGMGDQTMVGTDYTQLANDCKTGDTLLLDDGNIELEIVKIEGDKIHTEVIESGRLSDKKGINKKGGGISAGAITKRDEEIIKICSKYKIDFIAISFVSNKSDIDRVRYLVDNLGFSTSLIAKIEKADIFNKPETLEQIIEESDGVMVARGDLYVEVGAANMLKLQKLIIKKAILMDKFVITATQMMESMINNPIPTRAEISDVGNAVLDGTDAVMLSAETAVGSHPIKTVKAMNTICKGIESSIEMKKYFNINSKERIDKTLSTTIAFTADQLSNTGLIICCTSSGNTALWISRHNVSVPIIGVTQYRKSFYAMHIYRNVIPYYYEDLSTDDHFVANVAREVIEQYKNEFNLTNEKKIIISFGYKKLTTHTNSMAIYRVKELIKD